jgi:hypothetical protein
VQAVDVRCHYQLVNRTSKYFLPHIVKGEGLETSQFVFYSPVLGNLNTISLNLKIKEAIFNWDYLVHGVFQYGMEKRCVFIHNLIKTNNMLYVKIYRKISVKI